MNTEIEKIFEDFEFLEDWEDRYTYIIDLGKALKPTSPNLHLEKNKVTGCMSQVWLSVDDKQSSKDKMLFHADSDAIIVKGLVALLMSIYNGQSAHYILNTDMKPIFETLGLDKHLSPIRRNGFASMYATLKKHAKRYA